MKKHFFTLVLIVLISGESWCSGINSRAGTTGADFLKIPADPVSQSLGGAGFCWNEYASCLFSNPAIMPSLKNTALSICGSAWLLDSKFSAVSFVMPLAGKTEINRKTTKETGKKQRLSILKKFNKMVLSESRSAFGLGIIYFDAGEIKETMLGSGNRVLETGNSLKANDFCGILSYARNFSVFSAGINAKFIQRKLASESATAFAGDIGLHRIFNLHSIEGKLFCGILIENLGAKLDFLSETSYEDKLPVRYGIGTAFQYKKAVLLLNAAKPIDNDVKMNFGFDYGVMDFLHMRIGYKILGLDKDAIEGSLTGFSAGFGIPIKIMGGEISYSFVPYNDLKNTHHFGLNIYFGECDTESSEWYR